MLRSRRALLKSGALLLGGICAAGSALAQAKATKQAMQYQDQPKNGQDCDQCVHFVPGANADAQGTCKVVEGPISPKGWCVAFVKKA